MKIALVVASLAALSCGSKSAVTVTGTLEDPMLTVEAASVLATGLRGGFRLHLTNGKLSPDPADISLTGATFSLVRATDQSPLVVLRTTASVSGPVHLEPGAQADVTWVVGDGSGGAVQALNPQETANVCAAGSAEIVGTVGSSDPGPGTVRSSSLSVRGTGCPP